ncbi:MAG TPA: tetratricopeptide repeat protein [Gemmataceae bacterium]|nr:tetratricopeptide repeat protein [Gemmataceae bacterium]
MVVLQALDPANDLDTFVAAYEAAQARDGEAELTAFLPDPAHPLYGEVLRELVRIDLEFGWARGRPRALPDYQRDFPRLFEDAEAVRAITFEEYRLRRQAGEDPAPEDYERRYGIDVSDWPPPRQRAGVTTPVPATVLGSGAFSLFFRDVRRSDPRAARRLADALTAMPEAGTEFLGFHLLAELGRGAFGRVYLARQGELADRPVALKVSGDVLGESRALAQLRHTNIVPIFSVHHASPFHAVCMPFLGRTTLADVLDQLRERPSMPASGGALADAVRRGEPGPPLPALEGRTYVRAVLWVALRLAGGLAHAHEQGILHRDLKPANVLLADDGEPVLLDFNLSEDTKLRSSAAAAFAGGTLQYMPPEQLVAFRERRAAADARGDLYALGVILYELLTGRHPFPARRGLLDEALPHMIEDRLGPPPDPRGRNPAVSPAVNAIVRRCLEPDPGRRYQTARQLEDDLERQLTDRPLRHAREASVRERVAKWARRHPRLSSSTSVAVVAAALLLGLGGAFAGRQERLARLEAVEAFRQFGDDVRDARVAFLDAATGQVPPPAVTAACRRALGRFHVLDDPSWQQAGAVRRLPPDDRERLRADAGELLFLLAAMSPPDDASGSALDLNRRAESCYPEGQAPAALLRQRAALERQHGRPAEAGQLLARAVAAPPRTPRDLALLACAATAEGRFREARPLWERASARDPQNVWVWYGLGDCYDRLGRPAQAASCYSACVALNPAYHGWHFRRGLAHLRMGQYESAGDDFDQAIRLCPDHGEAHVNRALARLGAGRAADAVADLTRALELGAPPGRTYLIRARAREKAGDLAGAERDRAEGLRGEPADEAAWVARGVARVAADPDGALADFDRALGLNPRSLPALENRAHVLAERLGRTEEAVRGLDRLLAIYPEQAPARAARGVLLARLGERAAALRDAEEALTLDNSPAMLYQVGGIYALTSRRDPEDRARAFGLLASALRQGYGHDRLDADRDLDPVREDPRFRRLLEAAHALRPAPPPTPEGAP